MREPNSKTPAAFGISRVHGWGIAALIALVLGTALSHRIAPDILVEKMILAQNTPALRICSKTPGSHPIALFAHGVTASKETLFRLGEAFATAGFDCYLIDLPGHGESRQPFSPRAVGAKPDEIARTLGSVDVFLGHSMGAGAGAWSVRETGFRPKLFIALGNNSQLGDEKTPLLLLDGSLDEFIPPSVLRARADAEVKVFPWCDHLLEPYDPQLVNAATAAASAAVGLTPPPPPTAWLWRFAGLLMGMAGALGLIILMPEIHFVPTQARPILNPAIIIVTLVLTTGTWAGAAPNLHRLPWQLALFILLWAATAGTRKLRLPRWIFVIFGILLAAGCQLVAPHMRTVFPLRTLFVSLAVTTLFLCAAVIVAWFTSRTGTQRGGDIAMAIFASYAIGQCMPIPF